MRCGFSELLDSEIDVLENYVLACGVRGKSAWDKKWVRLPKHKAGYDIELLNQSREYIMELLKPVYQVFSDKKSTVKDYVLAIYKLIVLLDIPDKLAKKEQALLDAGDQTASKEYGQIYKIVMQLFEKYVAVLGDECMDAEEFTQILDAGLDAADVAVIPPGYDTVTIGDIERTRLTNIKVMFFAGVNDGIVPKAAGRGGIISQYEREALKELDIELAPGAREQAFIQRFYLYLNMTKPSRELYISYTRLDSEKKAAQPSYLIGILKGMFPELVVTETEDVDWVNNWKKYFHQFYIDDILVIPSWEDVKTEDSDKMVIHIDPGTAFGTGMHETTQLCIRALRKYTKKDALVLDVGCGSGILGMLALKFGAGHSIGTDLDPCAIDATHENMEVNGIGKDQYEVMIGNIIDDKAVQDQVGYEKYDIVAANILADVLVPLTPVIVHQMKPGAVYITSGIIDDKEEVVVEAVKAAGLTVLEVNHQGEWVSVVAKKEE